MKKIVLISFSFLLLWMAVFSNYALGEVSTCSNSVFRKANLTAATSGTVTFTAVLKNKGDISVTACSVERWDGTKWCFVKSLSVPDGKTGVRKYSASKDYASSLTKGNTYRFRATYTSGKEKASAISNAITY